MKKTIRSISGLLAVVFVLTSTLFSCPITAYAAQNNTELSNPDNSQNTGNTAVKLDTNRDKTEIIVKYKTGGKQKDVETRIKGKQKLKKFQIKRSFKKAKVDLLEIDKNDDINKTILALKNDPDVEYAQPNYKLTVEAVPTDARYAGQWGLSNSGQEIEGYPGRTGVDINALNAWNLVQQPAEVVIGVLDTGIDINHEDLKNNIYINTGEIPNNGIDEDGNGYVDDINGWDFVNNDNKVCDPSSLALELHGTQVAGIIAAEANNTGVVGAAPKAKLLPLKFINGNWGYTCDAIDAIEYAMAKGVKIINCSFGGTDNNVALKDTMASSGILFVCSGGNRGADVSVSPVYPACFDIPNVLSVASIDNMGVISPYSSYGNKIHVAAPGINILTTTPNNSYGYFSGTSASAPFATGVAALLKGYLPNLSITEISNRIKNYSAPCTNLAGKVTSGGRVDAYGALTNTRAQTDTYSGPGTDNSTVPAGQQGGNVDTWYTLDQLAKIKEKLHYGESGVNPASGNFSFSVNDMSIPAPGFQVNIARTYNSRNSKSTPMGQGWTFGFEGKVEGTDIVSVTLPNGGSQRFRLSGGIYTPEDNRSTFVRNTDGTCLLTTKDQYKYTFNSSGYLSAMTDRNGNTLSIQVDAAGKITQITDTVQREYELTYNTNGLISKITDPENRQVTYEYDSNNRLETVTDPKGGVMRYSYDSLGFINEIRDHNNNVVEKLTYNHAEGENQYKVSQATDSLGDLVNYTYDMTNKKTTVTDMNGRVSTYWFDKAMYTIQVQDPDGKSSYTEYDMPDGTNKYGDVKSTTDKYGNKTSYEIDSRGNVIQITNPDGSIKRFEFDEKNNLVKDADETGRSTYYVYDTNKINLVKKVIPLDGTTPYTGTDSPEFAITAYSYYTGSESGCAALKLLKSETDQEGNVTTYTYDIDGNIKTVSDPQTGGVTQYEYNRIGWKTAGITPKGNRTEYSYDKNGQFIKSTAVSGKNETTRLVYNLLGQKIQEILPNQYNSANDDLTADTYSDKTAGTKYSYYPTGKLEATTDALGNITGYTYDVYGNTRSVTRPNGSVYRYEYDVLDRPVREYFKESSIGAEILLREYSYGDLGNGNTQETETVYLNTDEKAITVSVYDYASRLAEKQNPDGTKVKMTYYPDGTLETSTAEDGSITYYKYNGLGLLSEQWTPLEVSNGDTYYSYSKTEYYKNGWKYKEYQGKDKVLIYSIPTNKTIDTSEYYKNGKLKATTDREGRKSEYVYDNDGNVIKEYTYTDAENMLLTEYTYNCLEKVETKAQHINGGDIAGNSFNSTADTSLTTAYTYDKNGNVKTVKTPDQVVTTYSYDVLDRQIEVSKPGLDETGASVTISAITAYNWEGKPLSETDANGNTTNYEYNKMGLLTRTTDALNGVALSNYDIAGRKTAEVSPANYSGTKSLSEMNRVEYIYDLMGRIKAKKNIYYDSTAAKWNTVVTKAFRYNNTGNVIKELDALGYESGTGTSVDERIDTGYGTESVYDLAGRLSTVTDPVSKERALSFTTKYGYDGLGRKVSETNAQGVITTYAYDDAGNLLSTGVQKTADAQMQIVQSGTYDLAGRLLTKTDGNGNTTTYEYNAFGQVRKSVTPHDQSIPANTITYQYDKMGRLAKQSDSTGLFEEYGYDNEGRQTSLTLSNAAGNQSITATTSYDKNGNARFTTDGNGNLGEQAYDRLNRLKTTSITVGGIKKVTTYGYDSDGNQTSATDWRGNVSTNVYDPLGRVIEKHDPFATTIQKLEYNKNGVQVKSYDALGNETQYLYDKNNRLIATIDPGTHTTSQSYDDAGNIKSKTDGRNITTTYNYDELNRLQSVINANFETTSYTYDLNGNVLTQTDGKGNTTTYEYNVANKPVKKIDQGGMAGNAYLSTKTESYTYNADGSLKNVTDRNGVKTSRSYDIFGRVQVQTAGAVSTSYTYDNNGNQLTMIDSTGTTTREYDAQNRVISKRVPAIGETTFTYDGIEPDGGYSETTRDPKENITKKVYDKAGRLLSVISGADTTTYAYYDNGSRKSVTYAGGAKEEYTYDADGLVKTLKNSKADNTLIDLYSYTYDSAHNQTAKIDAKGTTTYSYDSLERLETVTGPTGRKTAYTFDKAGNRLTETVTAGTSAAITLYTYNEQNRLLNTVANQDNTTVTLQYTYDNNGNLISKSTETKKPVDTSVTGSFSMHKAGTSTESAIVLYKYDSLNQLAAVTTGDKTEKYIYNGEGYRVVKNDKGQITHYLYESDKVILETNAAGTQTARNVYGINLISRTSDDETLHYMYNGHADVTSLIDNTGVRASYYYDAFGTILEEKNYDASGNAIQAGAGTKNAIRYAGYQYDSETGLYYLNARYYDSKIARFLSEDSYSGNAADPLSLNLYTYCHNEPIMYSDPTGHIRLNDDTIKASPVSTATTKPSTTTTTTKPSTTTTTTKTTTTSTSAKTTTTSTSAKTTSSTTTAKTTTTSTTAKTTTTTTTAGKTTTTTTQTTTTTTAAKPTTTTSTGGSSSSATSTITVKPATSSTTTKSETPTPTPQKDTNAPAQVATPTQGTGNGSSSTNNKANTNNSFSWSELGNKASQILIVNAGLGMGLGLDNLHAGPVKVSAGASAIDELSYEKGKFDIDHKASADIGVDVKKVASIGAGIENKQSAINYTAPAQTSHKVGVTFLDDKNLCLENPGADNDYKLTAGGTVALGIAVEFEVGINVNKLVDTVKYIFTSKKK